MTDTLLSQESASAHARPGTSHAGVPAPALTQAALDLAARGTVLLRNEPTADGRPVLPLAPDEPVALLGRVQKDWISVGYGSGGDVNTPYTTNLLDSLREGGTAVDPDLAAYYEAFSQARPADPGTEWGAWPLSFPEPALDETLTGLIDQAAGRCRTAVVVLGRAAGEDLDSALAPGSYLLTDDERALVTVARERFAQVVAVVVTGNVIDLSWAEEIGVDALLLAWFGGMEGGRATAQVLTGALEPGGRLPASVVRSYADHPASGRSGDPEANDFGEDVFVGYRYLETFAPEAVQYPFGYGLGYGTHDLGSEGVTLTEDGAQVEVRVTGTSERASSTVAQLYVAKPTDLLPQPARELVGFGRTDALARDEVEDMTLLVTWRDLASYDDTGVSGHRFAWVLVPGTYTFYLGGDVRSAREVGTLEVEETVLLEQLEQAAAPAGPLQRMTRLLQDDGTSRPGWEPAPVSEVDLRSRILDRLPEAVPAVDETVTFDEVVAGERTLDELLGSLNAEDLARLTYGDIEMNSPYGAAGNAGAFGGVSESLRARGVPAAITTDGPSGIRLAATASLLPCGTALASSWDPEAVEALARLHAEEMALLGSEVLLSPGMNLHRDPLCGRNFEYFSEDPVLTGAMGASVVLGTQSGGLAACPKHFAVNSQETNRIHVDSRLSERALREVYLRGFEIVVTESRPRVLMTSYNKVNGVWSHYHYDLVTTILRGEWGFEGVVVTDWWMRMAPSPEFPGLRDSAYRVRAGVDVLMPGGDSHGSSTREDAVMDGYRAWLEAGGAQAGREAAVVGLTPGEVQDVARRVLGLLVARARR